MPGVMHIGLGMAGKKIAPKVPLFLLIIAAEFVEIMFFLFLATGLENIPQEGEASFSPYSHSIVMGTFWALLFTLIIFFACKHRFVLKDKLVLSGLALSHIILDVIASPQKAFFPDDLGKPVFLNPDVRIGLGLWSHKTLALSLEYGLTTIGLLLAVSVIISERKKRQGELKEERNVGTGH